MLKNLPKHQQCPEYVPSSTLWCPTRIHSRTIGVYDLFYFIKDAQLLTFADDIAVVALSNSVDDLTTVLQKESENAIDWLKQNGSKS